MPSSWVFFQLLAFIRAYSLLDDGNKLALYTVGAAVASLPTAPAECIAPSAAGLSQPPTDHNKLADTAESTLERLRIALAHRSGDLGGSGPAAWSSALLRAMCFVNKSRQRIEERQTAPPARFLCIKGSGDDSGQYLAFMNAVFAAQVRV